eukprot:6214528-Pleurochrysis_carterae.AAC.1
MASKARLACKSGERGSSGINFGEQGSSGTDEQGSLGFLLGLRQPRFIYTQHVVAAYKVKCIKYASPLHPVSKARLASTSKARFGRINSDEPGSLRPH